MLEWLYENIEWVFSGIGVAVLCLLVALVRRNRRSRTEVVQQQKSGRESINIQTGRNANIQITKRQDEAGNPVGKADRLTSVGEMLLTEAAKDKQGIVKVFRKSGGLVVATNDRNLVNEGEARSEAEMKSAVHELQENRLLEQTDSEGCVFQLTAQGYKTVDALNARSKLD